MTTNQKSPGKPTPTANLGPISIQAEIADGYEEVVAEPVALAPVAPEEVATELVEIKAVAVSVAATLGALPSGTSPEANKSDAEFDLSAWPLNILDLFQRERFGGLRFCHRSWTSEVLDRGH